MTDKTERDALVAKLNRVATSMMRDDEAAVWWIKDVREVAEALAAPVEGGRVRKAGDVSPHSDVVLLADMSSPPAASVDVEALRVIAELDEREGDTLWDAQSVARAALNSAGGAVPLPVGRVQRGRAPHDNLYAMLLPTAPRTPAVKEGDLLYTAPPAASVDVAALRAIADGIDPATGTMGCKEVADLLRKLIDSAGGAKVYQCPRCSTSMEVDPTAKPAPQPAEGDGAVDPADWPECSGNPGICPENEGYGCCKPNSEAVEDQPPHGFIKVRDAVRGVVAVSKVFPGDIIAEEYETRPAATAVVPDGFVLVPRNLTNSMQIAGLAALDDSDATPPSIGHLIGYKAIRELWTAMLAAALGQPVANR